MSDFAPKPDVRYAAYIRGGCPGCGRHRLEVYVDGPEGEERAVGIRCEKCYRQWLLDPEKADFHGDYSDTDPLNPRLPKNDQFGGADAMSRAREENAMSHISVRVHRTHDGMITRVESVAGEQMRAVSVSSEQSADDPYGTVTLRFPRQCVEFVEDEPPTDKPAAKDGLSVADQYEEPRGA